MVFVYPHGIRPSPANLEQYANAITRQGSPLTNCLGFVDGTVHPICRPGEIQHIVYNGHAGKFQSLALPNGLNRKSLWPCIEGRRHDAGMLKDSGLLNILEKVAYSPVGNVLSIYGDPAYPIRPHLTVPNRVGEVEMFTPYMPCSV